MKQAFSFIEVLISVLLLSITLGALYKIDDFGATLIQNAPKNSATNEFLSLVPYENGDKTFYLQELGTPKDDDIRRFIKEVKITLKQTPLDTNQTIEDVAHFGMTHIQIGDETKKIIRILP